MKKLIVVLVLLFPSVCCAQDTNLFQILLDGEDWKKVEGTALPSENRYQVAPAEQAIYSTNPKRKVAEGIGQPAALALSPDGGALVVADAAGKHLYAFRVEKDGSLTGKEAYGTMLLPHGQKASGAAGMTVDSAGRYYVSTPIGIQVFDATCRLVGIIRLPSPNPGALAFGGPDGNILHVACGDQLFARKTKAQGVRP